MTIPLQIFFIFSLLALRIQCIGRFIRSNKQSFLQSRGLLECLKATKTSNQLIELTNQCNRDIELRNSKLRIYTTPPLQEIWGTFSDVSYPKLKLKKLSDSIEVSIEFDEGSWIQTGLHPNKKIEIKYWVDSLKFHKVEFNEQSDLEEIKLEVDLPQKPQGLVDLTLKSQLLSKSDNSFSKYVKLFWGEKTFLLVPKSTNDYILIPEQQEDMDFLYKFEKIEFKGDQNKIISLNFIKEVLVKEAISLKLLGISSSLEKPKINIVSDIGKSFDILDGQQIQVAVQHKYQVFAHSVEQNSEAIYKAVNINPEQFELLKSQKVTINIQYEKIEMKGASVRGWPSYIAHGAVTNVAGIKVFQERPVDALFKYAGNLGNGDKGQLVYPIFTKKNLIQCHNLTELTKRRHIPVMVVYTAEMSLGASLDDFAYGHLTKHYINLMMICKLMQSFRTDANPMPGALVMNPDLMGMIQQQNLLNPGNALDKLRIEVNQALRTSMCFISGKYSYQGQMLDYQELFDKIREANYNDFEASYTWEREAYKFLEICENDPESPFIAPQFTNDFPGWIQSTNWLIRKFGPDVTFGWQENVWSIGSSHFVKKDYTDEQILQDVINPCLHKWKITHSYEGPYRPDFFVFDKYERDSTDAFFSGYLWNNRDIDNYIRFVKGISYGLDQIPVMLWQIPGGHLQNKNGVDQRDSHGSTEPDWIFGNDVVGQNLENLKDYFANLPLPKTIYGTSSVKEYLGGYDWSKNNLNRLQEANVFAILWGGGSTTSVSAYPQDDGGYLYSKIKKYYDNPTPVRKN